jgi:hypothetical protein
MLQIRTSRQTDASTQIEALCTTSNTITGNPAPAVPLAALAICKPKLRHALAVVLKAAGNRCAQPKEKETPVRHTHQRVASWKGKEALQACTIFCITLRNSVGQQNCLAAMCHPNEAASGGRCDMGGARATCVHATHTYSRTLLIAGFSIKTKPK